MIHVALGIVEEIGAVKQPTARIEKDCEERYTKKNQIRSNNLLKDIDIYDSKQNETMGDIERLKKTKLVRRGKTLFKNNLRIEQEL
jgi:hypothetical protein